VKFNVRKKKVIAVASDGGHWVQLLCLMPFLNKYETVFCSTNPSLSSAFDKKKYFTVTDVSRDSLFILPITVIKALLVLLYIRPQLIVSTGALPGVVFIVLGKVLFGSKTIWVDSIANGNTISVSGRLARKFSDIWVSQWEDLAKESGAEYLGQVI